MSLNAILYQVHLWHALAVDVPVTVVSLVSKKCFSF